MINVRGECGHPRKPRNLMGGRIRIGLEEALDTTLDTRELHSPEEPSKAATYAGFRKRNRGLPIDSVTREYGDNRGQTSVKSIGGIFLLNGESAIRGPYESDNPIISKALNGF